jgi:phage shock protein A
LFGYVPSEVDERIARLEADGRVMQAELEQLRAAPAVSPEVSSHLASLLQSFAETVAEGQREAEARSAQIVADAEERAAQLEANALKLLDQANEMVANTYADASARYQEAIAARQNASERIGEAAVRLADALAILSRAPEGLVADAPVGQGEETESRASGSVDTDLDGDPPAVPGGGRWDQAPPDEAASGEPPSTPTVLSMVMPYPAA